MQLVRLALLAGVALATCAPAQEAIRLKTRTLVQAAASPRRAAGWRTEPIFWSSSAPIRAGTCGRPSPVEVSSWSGTCLITP